MKHTATDPLFSFDHAVIFNTMTEGIYVHDLDMTITYINPAAAKISGWQAAEAIGKKCWEVFGDLSLSCRQGCPLQLALASGQAIASQDRIIRQRNGATKEIRVILTPYRKDGAIVGSIVIVCDISESNKTLAAYQQEIGERKQAEESLARRNEILSIINYLQGEFFLEEDPRAFFGKLIDVFLGLTKSRFGFIAEVGYSAEEDLFLTCLSMRGLPTEMDLHEDTEDAARPGLRLTSFDNLLGSILRSGKVVIANDPPRDPRRGSLPAGHPPLSAFLGLPLYAGKTLVGIVGMANRPDGYDQELVDHIQPAINAAANLVKTHCSERDRHKQEFLLSTMADTIEDIFWVNDLQTRTTIFASKAYESIWGGTRRELYRGEYVWAKAIHPDDQERVNNAFSRLGEGVRFDEIYRIIRPDGEIRWIRDHGSPIREGNSIGKAAGIAQDITSWRRMETDNARLKRQIEFILGAAKTRLSVVDKNFLLRYADPVSIAKYGPYEGKSCYNYFKGQATTCANCRITPSLVSGKPDIWETVIPQEGNRPVQRTTFPFIDESGEQLFAEVTVDISAVKEAEAARDRTLETLALHNKLLELSFANLVLPELLNQCLGIITSIPWLNVKPQGAIFLKDPDHDLLILKAHIGLNSNIISTCGKLLFGTCLCGMAAQEEGVVWANHIDQRHSLTYSEMTPHGHFCIPFFSSDRQLLGVFTVYTAANVSRDKELERTLVLLAKILALIIERRLFEEAVIQARDEWEQTFDAVGDMVMVIDCDYQILKINKAMAKRLGGPPEHFVGGRCYHLLHESEGPAAGCPHSLTLSTGEPQSCELSEGCLGGDFMISAAPIMKEDGKVIKSVHVIHDQTEHKRHERQLQQFADTQAVLLREVNHRVKNNLTAIISMLHKEEDRALRDNQHEIKSRLSDIESRIEGLMTVHSLLSASEWQPLSLHTLCQEVAQRAAVCTDETQDVALKVANSDVLITSDQAHYLALVINELTTNTVKYATEKRNICQITIDISRDDDIITLTYRDDGPGFPEAVIEEKPLSKGIGFDLISGIIRKSLRGTLSLSNEAGGVARITFTTKTNSK
ncbi:MAG: PAS domain S-box protein [Desulfobulbaceae bacterium]|nr:PAS domain S-box protein [Desulfobulbaceae bacterium]